MATQEHIRKPTSGRTEAVVEAPPANTDKGDKMIAELDNLLNEIDELLEENAEEFVRAYVQKGGQ